MRTKKRSADLTDRVVAAEVSRPGLTDTLPGKPWTWSCDPCRKIEAFRRILEEIGYWVWKRTRNLARSDSEPGFVGDEVTIRPYWSNTYEWYPDSEDRASETPERSVTFVEVVGAVADTLGLMDRSIVQRPYPVVTLTGIGFQTRVRYYFIINAEVPE